ncbi:MAG: M28 family peptidase [Candidatus Aminicenantes bacterium]|nr:M28 family peptidase [Candidatus Aminicenantes bacterium]
MAESAGGKSRLFPGILVIFVIVLAAFLSILTLAPPRVVPAGAPVEEFSAERAYALLKEIAVNPHPLGTPEHDEVRDTIMRMWRDLGMEPEIQKGMHFDGKGHWAARVENILVRLPGTRPIPGRTLMLAAHYDSVQAAPGAADDGAAVVTLLETARALKAGPPLAGDVIFLITDGEEDGLLGAQVFQAEHPWAGEVGLVLNFEARGTNGPSLMFQSSSGNKALVSALAASPHPRAYSMGAMAYRSMPNNSDLSIWLDAGIQGLNFAWIGRAYDYHSSGDNLARLDLRSLQHHGSYALFLARRFGNEGIPAPIEGDAVHFSLAGDILIRYNRPTAYAFLALILNLLILAGVIAGKRGLLRAADVLRGVAFMLGAVILSGGLGFGLLSLVRAVHGTWLPSGPWRYSPGYLLAVILLGAAATTLLSILLKGRKSAFGSAFGAAVLWLVLAAAVTLFAFDAGYVGVFPALSLAIGVLAWALAAKKGVEDPAPPLWVSALTAAVVVLVAVPLILLLFQAMFLSPFVAAILGALTAAMLAAMTPAVELCRRGMGRGLSVFLFGLFFAAAAASALTVRYTAEIPRLVSLQYRHDLDTGRAFWVTRTATLNPWLKEIVGSEWRSGHPEPEQVGNAAEFSYREAPVSSLTPPDVQVIEDVVLRDAPPSPSQRNSRVLALRVVSPRGGRRLTLTVKAEGLQSAEIDGRHLELIPENASGFGAVFLNPGPGGVELRLKTAAGPVSLTVRESNPVFPDLPGFNPMPPPPGVRLDRKELLLSKTFVFPPPAESEAAPSVRR